MPTEEIQFDVGVAWSLDLPPIKDPDFDPILIEVTSPDTPFVKATVDPPRLFIEPGATSSSDVGKFRVQFKITDQPVEGAKPLSETYSVNIFGVDPALLEALERQKPPPVQVGTVPKVKVGSISQYGTVSLQFNKDLSFPSDNQNNNY